MRLVFWTVCLTVNVVAAAAQEWPSCIDPSWSLPSSGTRANAAGCTPDNDCRLPDRVPPLVVKSGSLGLIKLAAAFTPIRVLDPGPGKITPCIDPSVTRPPECIAVNEVYRTDDLRTFTTTVPAPLRGGMARAFAEGIRSNDSTAEEVLGTQLLLKVIEKVLKGTVKVEEVEGHYDQHLVPLWNEDASAIRATWEGGAVQSQPAVRRERAPAPLDEIAHRDDRAFCAFRMAQQRRSTYQFRGYDVGLAPFFSDPLLTFTPVFTIERTVPIPAASCFGHSYLVSGRYAMRVRALGADLGDLGGTWQLVTGDIAAIEKSDPATFFETVCDDANHCRSTSVSDFRTLRARTARAGALTASGGRIRGRVDFPLLPPPLALNASADFRVIFGDSLVPDDEPQPRAFPPFTSSFTPRPLTDGLIFFTPPGNRPVHIFDGVFRTNPALVFNGLTTLTQDGRDSQLLLGASGATMLFPRMAANDDRVLPLHSELGVGIGLFGGPDFGWLKLEFGGNITLNPYVEFHLRDLLTAIDGGSSPKPDRYASTIDLTARSGLRADIALWAALVLQFELPLIGEITIRETIFDFERPFIDDSSDDGETHRLRLTTWTNAAAQSGRPHPAIPEWSSHLPGTNDVVEPFAVPDDISDCIRGTTETPQPPVPPGTCNGDPPHFVADPCFVVRTGIEVTNCPLLEQIPIRDAASTYVERADCRAAEQWFVCRGRRDGSTISEVLRLIRRITGDDQTRDELAVTIAACARRRVIDAGGNVNDRASTEAAARAYVRDRLTLCGTNRPLVPADPTVTPAAPAQCVNP